MRLSDTPGDSWKFLRDAPGIVLLAAKSSSSQTWPLGQPAHQAAVAVLQDPFQECPFQGALFQELNPAPIPNLHRRSKTLPGLQAHRAQLAAAFMSRTHPAGSRSTPDRFPTPCGLPEFAPQPSLAVKLQGLPRDLMKNRA
ncbi:hypothetical protein [Achromobacter mucicolens]|uniref:hypothetical protein n=1 Tax=Achromobacter mucicolens TaxID=1389922 RepID=UPI003975197C